MFTSADCLKRAEEMDRAAERARDTIAKADFKTAAQQWRDLAATAARLERQPAPDNP